MVGVSFNIRVGECLKVLNSTENDRVFINFADHGGPGILAMPVGPFLYAKDLQNALKKMHNKKMYKELVFYVEALGNACWRWSIHFYVLAFTAYHILCVCVCVCVCAKRNGICVW